MPEISDSRIAARITFDEPRNIFYSGQVLKGNVEFKLTIPLSYSVININFLGEAKVFWSESETEECNGIQRYVTVSYKGNETYFDTTICASGGKGAITLPPGNHKVPFQFQIPHTAPSTFRGEKGTVSYKITAYIEHADPLREKETLEDFFEVVAPLDLNTLEDVKQPINLEFEETVAACCSNLSLMRLRIHIPASGFCPGQAIPISISAENESNVDIKKIIIQLLQKVCYHSTEPKSDYIEPKVLETIKTRRIPAKTKRNITCELTVPSFIAYYMQNSKLIDVGYFLKVTIKLSSCNDDLEDESEIFIGLVPLSSLVDNYQHPMQSDLPQAPIPDPKFAPPVQNMPYQGDAMQNSAANNTSSSPYPSSGGPFPSVTPYPPNASPNQSNETPHAPKSAPYSSNSSPFPSHATPYPPDKANQPHPQHGTPMASLRTGNIGFVSPPKDYGKKSPSPEANPPYPGANPPYPGANPPYPGANPSYPEATFTNPPYPTSNLPYPGANSPYPGQNPPFPGQNPPYPGVIPRFPFGDASYSTHQPAKSFQAPYPLFNAPSAPPS
ncbi:arrestin domain-containing protein 1 [Phthorimaea operculella]|nr:arrestin domain-containing protein 1 [Phthorimaea operculella]